MRKTILPMASRVWLIYAVNLLVCLLFFTAFLGDNRVLSVLLDVALLGGVAMLLYSEGAYRGERDVAHSEMIDRRAQEGYVPQPEDLKMRFEPMKGVRAALLAALPMLLVAALCLIGYLLSKDDAPTAPSAAYTMFVFARMLFMPFLPLVLPMQDTQPLLQCLLLFPLALFHPVAMLVGYLSGPKQRKRVHKMIEEGTKKKLRRMRMERKKRQQGVKPPKMEI